MDDVTQKWMRNEADARAAANGYRFDLERAAFPVWWIGRYCRLYEGTYAGQPMVLRGAHSQELFASQLPWKRGGKEETIRYIREYMECQAAGEACDWQLEVFCRIFGWVGHSERWDGDVRRFTKGSIFTSKKNKKSPGIAAIGLYLACADGEPGNKVFFLATNLDQAKDIAATHATQMVRQSPELLRECEIKQNTARITHAPTNSILQPLSSGNERSQQSKEGLNGSGLVDEAHVVTRAFMSRMVRMGISRKEPLILDFSTAGNDIETYGYDQWEYGTANNRKGEDEHHFFQTYEAPQDLSDSDLAADPEKYIRMANPALGHTVDMAEALQDYRNSRSTQAKLAEFKQYRLNIWSRTSTPWISGDDWARSARRGRKRAPGLEYAWGGLHVGYTDEPSAFTLAWPTDRYAIDEAVANKVPLLELLGALDQPVYTRTWYWLPKGAIEQWRHALPYGEWAKSRAVKVQRGRVLDPNGIIADVVRIMRDFDVQAVAYDPWQAATIMDRVCKEEGYPHERLWEFSQRSPATWALPCAVLERLLISGKLKHQRSAPLDWEIGHATVKPDRLGGVSLILPPRDDRKKVNGLSSLIMALDAMARAERHYRSQLMVLR